LICNRSSKNSYAVDVDVDVVDVVVVVVVVDEQYSDLSELCLNNESYHVMYVSTCT
jgi:hypothetical protein